MKKVLSLLVVFVFLQGQTWALSGGPVYGGAENGSRPDVSGTYGGVLVGVPANAGVQLDVGAAAVAEINAANTAYNAANNAAITAGTVTPNPYPVPVIPKATGANSIGMFSVQIPAAGGLGVGTAVIFAAGQVFTDTLTAVADTNHSQFTALAQSGGSVSQGGAATASGSDAPAIDGSITAKINGEGKFLSLEGSAKFTVSQLNTLIPASAGTAAVPASAGPPPTAAVAATPAVTAVTIRLPVGTLVFNVVGIRQAAPSTTGTGTGTGTGGIIIIGGRPVSTGNGGGGIFGGGGIGIQ